MEAHTHTGLVFLSFRGIAAPRTWVEILERKAWVKVVSTYRHFPICSEGPGEDVQVHQDGGHGVAAVAQQPLGGLVVVGDELGVEEQRGLADGDEILEEALARVRQCRVRAGVEGPAEPDLVPRQSLLRVLAREGGRKGLFRITGYCRSDHDLSYPDEALA